MLRVLHLGSYSQGSNDIVFMMQQALAQLCDLQAVDLQLYRRFLHFLKIPSTWVHRDEGRNWLIFDKIEPLIEAFKPAVVVCNAGGISFRPEHHKLLEAQGIVRIGIALSDPDVFPYHGRVFSQYFSLFYTNAKEALPRYTKIGVAARLLPFAGLPQFHRPMPDVPKRYDVIVVGEWRPDRQGMVDALKKAGLKVGLFGAGWSRLGRLWPSSVHGQAHVRAINSGKMYLSFSRTLAGFMNVKIGVFEAAACCSCILTERFDEMADYFEYGKEIVGYESVEEAVELATRYAHDEKSRSEIADNCYKRFLSEHTWQYRWTKVLADVNEICKDGHC